MSLLYKGIKNKAKDNVKEWYKIETDKLASEYRNRLLVDYEFELSKINKKLDERILDETIALVLEHCNKKFRELQRQVDELRQTKKDKGPPPIHIGI
jgi:hypothetical protein